MENKNPNIKIPIEKIVIGEIRKTLKPVFQPVEIKHVMKIEGIPEQIKTEVKMPEIQKVNGKIEVTNFPEQEKVEFPKEFRIANAKDLKPEITVEKVEFPEVQKVEVTNHEFQEEIIAKVEFPEVQKVEEINKQDFKSEVKDALKEVIVEMAKNPDDAFNVRAVNLDEGKAHFGNFGGGGSSVQGGARFPNIATNYFTYNINLTASGILFPFTFPSNTLGYFVKIRTQSKKLRIRTINDLDEAYFTVPQNGWWTVSPINLKEKTIYLEGENITGNEVVEVITLVK